MKYLIRHETRYSYADSVSLSHNEAYLTPRSFPGQTLEDFHLAISPAPSQQNQRIDYFGNPFTTFLIEEAHAQMVVSAQSRLVVTRCAPESRSFSEPWENVAQALKNPRTPDERAAAEFAFPSPFSTSDDAIREYAIASFSPGTPIFEGVQHLMQRLHRDFQYDKGVTSVFTSVQEVFRLRKGVCQDFAHLFIAMVRSLGLASRYISGYIETLPPAGKTKLVGSDASHAWIGVFCPPLGWVELDPTNDVLVGNRHITRAWGRDYGDVTPVKGIVLGGGRHTVHVAVDVKPSNESGN
jgi:transglutaminase-like putative cysteine protease